MTEQDHRPVVGDGCQCWITPPSTWTTHFGAVEPGSQVEQNPQCREHAMHALAIWCPQHRVVEPLTTVQAEELIHGLHLRWFDQIGEEREPLDWNLLTWCPTQLHRSLVDPEMYWEDISQNVDDRIVAELGEGALR